MRSGLLQNDNAVSPILGAILILAISTAIITNIQINFVPVWNTQEELNHLEKMNDDFRELKSSIEEGASIGTPFASPLSMGFKYSPKIIAYNPKESAPAKLSIQGDMWAEVRYNEVLPEGMNDATTIKNISTATITYSLLGTQNLSYFIYEYGLLRRSGSNYTSSAQTFLVNGSLYLLSVNATEPETTSGVERRVVNIYPTSQAKNSVIGKNVWLIMHTRYVDWWTDPSNPASLQNQGATIKKTDTANGTIIAYFNSIAIRMGETQVTSASKKPPSRLTPARLVRITPQNIMLPIEGITTIEVEVQDFYNNPVPNVLVNFNANSSGTLVSNAYSNAELLQTSAISEADGRAKIQLRTHGPGMYYIDASMPSYTATFVYPASSQGGFISLSYTGSEPLYAITATLRDRFGEADNGETISFSASEGTVSPPTNNTNAAGNASTVLNTSTATGIKLTNIQTGNITNNSARITWDTTDTITVAANRTPGGYIFNSIDIPTNVNSSGCVRYGTTQGNYPNINCSAFGSSHTVTLSGLLPYTAYYFIANSSRTGGASVNSSEYMFVTESAPSDVTPPASITGLNNVSYTPLFINWTWTDPADADFAYVQVYIDGASAGTVARGVQSYNTSYFMPNSMHIISTHTVDASNNVNATWVNNTANTSTIFTYVFDFLSTIGTVTNFGNAQNGSDGGASAALAEEMLTPTYNWSFTPPIVNNGSWTFSTTSCGTLCTVRAGSNSTDGVPPGSLFANLSATTSADRTAITSWRSPNFTWTNGTPASAVLNFSFRVTQRTLALTTATSAVFLIDPNGVKKQINQSTTYTAAGAWGNFSNSSIILSDFSVSGNYSILLNATLFTTNTGAVVNVSWDNPNITLITPYRLNITTNTTNIPDATTQQLQLRYNVSSDNFTLQIWNGSEWNNRTTLNDTVMSYRNITLQSAELLSDGTMAGNAATINKYYILVRYLDLNSGALQGRMYLDYQRVYSS